MKLGLIVMCLLGLLLLAPVAQAQGELPPTAGEAVKWVAVVLATAAGLLGCLVTEAIKRLPFFTEGERTQISGWVAQLVAGVASIASGYLVAWLAEYATALDELGLWKLVVIFGPWAVAELSYRFKKATG